MLFSNDDFVQCAVKELGEVDMSMLPKKIKTNLTNAVGDAEVAIVSLKSAIEQESIIEKESIEYRPILNKVRRLESRINQKKSEIKELKKEQVLQKTLKNSDAVEDIENEIQEVEKEIDKSVGLYGTELPQAYTLYGVGVDKSTEALEDSRTATQRAIDVGMALHNLQSDRITTEDIVADALANFTRETENSTQAIEAVSYTHLTLPTKRIV